MNKRNLSFIFATILLFAFAAVTFTANANVDDSSGINYYNFHNGIVDGSKYNTATVTQEMSWDTDFFLQRLAKITPNPSGAPDKIVSLDHYTLSSYNINAAKLKYISVYCKYEGSKTLGKARVALMPQNGKYYTETVYVYSNEDIKSGQWQWINFDVGSAAYGKVTDSTLYQFHLSPYGDIKSGELSSSDVMKIGKIRFLAYDKASGVTGRYPISFTGARPDVNGKDPETVYVNVGSSITLPENPYTRENYTFTGWICSADSQLYQPGDTYTVVERKRVEADLLYNYTGEAVFYPEWTINKVPSKLPDVMSAEYTAYNNGVVGNANTATITKNTEFAGRNTFKAQINTDSTNYLNLDSWEWQKLPLDLDKYNYITITYYFDADESKTYTAYPVLRFLTGKTLPITSEVFVSSETPLEKNKWAVMCFDLSAVKAKLDSSVESHILNQIHFYPAGLSGHGTAGMKASEFSRGDCFYIDAFTFYAEKPQGDLRIQQGLMVGDGNGNLRPHDTLTRAEAAAIILNVLANEGKITKLPENIHMTFTDVLPTDWYYYPVMAMDSLGYVPEDGLFRPNDPITVAEFLRFMTFIEKEGLHIPSFNGDAGSTEPITRAQAATILSDWHTNGVPEQFDSAKVKMFDDLDTDSPEYLPIMNICATRLSAFDGDGNETIYQLLCPGSTVTSLEYDTGDAEKYIKQLNKLENDRIAEIRSTPSEYTVKAGGRIYYVSSSEGTASGGDSEDNPLLITTLSQITSIGAKNGDVVLFKRGDIFRGCFTATAGVTYSAYGEGEKPKLYRSEKNHTGAENWEVYYQDTATGKTIWKTAYEVSQDVGAIVINDGQIVAYKEIPSIIDSVYYVRGQESVKEFVIVDELDNNHEFFHDLGGTTETTASGYIYFRCDEGNPGELFESIEMNQKTNLIRAASNVTVDNLCLKYFGSHGIGAGTVSNLTVTNCEIGWGGGSIQYYKDGKVVRFGNGVEIYGGLVNFNIDNCYVYEIYDAGITHQISTTSPGNFYMKDVVYSNNVLCNSTYNIEYFMSIDQANAKNERFMENVLFENNLIRRAGYGWGQQRTDDAPAGIKGWAHHNNAVNTVLRNNIIDRCYNHTGGLSHLMHMGSTYNASGPYLENNTFVQVPGRYFALICKTDYRYGLSTENDIIYNIGGTGNKVYFAAEDHGKG